MHFNNIIATLVVAKPNTDKFDILTKRIYLIKNKNYKVEKVYIFNIEF